MTEGLSHMQRKLMLLRLTDITLNCPNWETDPELCYEVHKLRLLIGSDEMGTSHPLPKMKLSEITPCQYSALKDKGYTGEDIRIACGVSRSKICNWRHDKGITKPRPRRKESENERVVTVRENH